MRPATRTWKNSSRFWLAMARNLARSMTGTLGSLARASTRSSKSSHESSRFSSRSGPRSTGPTVPAGSNEGCGSDHARVVTESGGHDTDGVMRHESVVGARLDPRRELVAQSFGHPATQYDEVDVDEHDRVRDGDGGRGDGFVQ